MKVIAFSFIVCYVVYIGMGLYLLWVLNKWGQREATAIIEVYGPEAMRGEVNRLAHDLREAFSQEAVAVAEHNDRTQFYFV